MPSITRFSQWRKYVYRDTPGTFVAPARFRVYNNQSLSPPFVESTYLPCLQVRGVEGELSSPFSGNMVPPLAANPALPSGTLKLFMRTQGSTLCYYGVMVHTDQLDLSNQTGKGYAMIATTKSDLDRFQIWKCTDGFMPAGTPADPTGTLLASSASGIVSRTDWMACVFDWWVNGSTITLTVKMGLGTDFGVLPTVVTATDSPLAYTTSKGFSLVFSMLSGSGCFLVGPTTFNGGSEVSLIEPFDASLSASRSTIRAITNLRRW